MPPPAVPTARIAARMAEALTRHRAGDLAGAEQGYRAVLAAEADHREALHLLGVLHHQQGRDEEAVRLIGRAIDLGRTGKHGGRHGGVAEHHANLGLALHALGRLDAAEAAYRQALALREAYPEAHNSLGSALQEMDRLAEAAIHYRRALDLRRDYAEAWANLGTLLRAQDDYAEAEAALRHALRLDPGHTVALTNLGVVLKETGRPAEAEAAHQEALRLAPDDAETLVNLALLREAQGRGDEAERLYRAALERAPGFALARWNLALRLLGQGRLAEGLEQYEARFASRRVAAGRSLALPVWDGQAGARILVWREQGLGDELMFGTALPDLVDRTGGGSLVVEVDARLVGLVGRALPGVMVRAETASSMDADAHLPMGSLPRLLRRGLADFPARTAWLAPDPERAALWRDRLAALGPGLRVGLCWGSQNMLGERKNAYTTLADWAPLLTLPGVTPVTLQYDGREAEIAAVEARFGVTIHRWADSDLKNDLEGVAALTSQLDLVVTVASSVGEMAGALGVPVWRFGGAGDWTALGTGVRPWFPSMRLWSARPGESLPDVLVRIAAEIRRLAVPPALAPAPPVAAWLAEARALHDGGRWPEAEKAYQRILDQGGEVAAALEGYGQLGAQAGRPDIAVTLLSRALAVEPTAGRHKRRAEAHQRMGALAEAEADWRAAAAFDEGDVEALGNLGALLLTRGAAAEAAVVTAKALRHAPDHAGLWTNAGLARQAAGEDGGPAFRRAVALDPALTEAWTALSADALRDAAATAEGAARRALTLRPGDPAAASNRGLACLVLDRPAEAVDSLRLALRSWPGDAGTLGNLALALERTGDGNAAGLAWWRVILLDPGAGAGWAGLADLRQRQGRLDAALKGWSRALAAEPRRADWRYNLGNALHAAGRPLEADAAYRQAVEADPGLTLAAFNRGYAALARGDLAAGWAGLEARFAAGQALPDRRFRIPAWNGGELGGRTVLVWREQGVGDELMHSSCYAELIARAGRVIVECEPRLVALFARSFPQALVRAATDDPVDADCHVAAGSLPLRLRAGLANFPAQAGWLRADAAAVERWRGWLGGVFHDSCPRPDPPPLGGGGSGRGHPPQEPGLTVGLCWRSRFRSATRDGNYTTLDQWAPILTLPGLRLVNLQYDECEAELAEAEARFGVTIHRPPLDLMNDLDGAAALTAALDLVISAGTSVAEMAGALGVPVWRIGPAGDWTALGTGCRPWYPAMRLFSPAAGETLGDALDAAGRALEALRTPGLRTRERPRS